MIIVINPYGLVNNNKNVMENNMEKETFEKEIAMCQKLSKKNGGKCNWGECKKCGVIPMLYKLGKEENYEEKESVKKLKDIVLREKN
ncbi:MAG: hypothetical protein PHR47_01185 [Candidatus Pacebacteria bacterium]|nr:hypothetical protein [Candidatus Paceibacterota bacterium]